MCQKEGLRRFVYERRKIYRNSTNAQHAITEKKYTHGGEAQKIDLPGGVRDYEILKMRSNS